MNIIVCAKQVPDSSKAKIDPLTGTLIREGVQSILNPDDANALEEAIRIKENNESVKITVITMGPPQAEVMLRECLAMGADEAILLSDRSFVGSDTWATANTISAAIKKSTNADIVFVGKQSTDGSTAQVGPQIAERLGIAQVTCVQKVKMLKDKELLVQRQLENGYENIKVKTPVLLSAVKELNEPRYMSVLGICEAYNKEIQKMCLRDLDLNEEEVGLNASPTKVINLFNLSLKGKGKIFEGESKQIADILIKKLKETHLI